MQGERRRRAQPDLTWAAMTIGRRVKSPAPNDGYRPTKSSRREWTPEFC